MALLGKGAMVFWHDLAPSHDAADFERWHSIEHMPERLGVPGFRRGRRCMNPGQSPRYFIMYEVADLSTLTSKPYLDRLNDPTPWTTKSLAAFRNSNRTLCRVAASLGHGVGSAVLTVRLAPAPGKEAGIAAALAQDLLPRLIEQPGVMAAHLLQGDEGASRTETAEKKLRDKPDDVADWVVIAEGYDADAVAALRDGPLWPGRLADLGAAPEPATDGFRLLHVMAEADL